MTGVFYSAPAERRATANTTQNSPLKTHHSALKTQHSPLSTLSKRNPN
ncbi:hypothetical protein [Nostoc sp. UHCC 0870]